MLRSLLPGTVGAVVLVTLASVHMWTRVAGDPLLARRRVLSLFLRTLGVLVAPLILCYMLPSCAQDAPHVLPALLWNGAFWIVDAFFLQRSSKAKATVRTLGLQLDPMPLTGLALGLSGLVGNQPRSPYSRLFALSVLLSFLVVLPSHTMPPESLEATLLDGLQRAVLQWCIMLLIAAVLLTQRHAAVADK